MEPTGMAVLGEVVADDRARMAFGRLGVRKNDRYAVAVGADGTIVLTPLLSVPNRELLVWESRQLRKSLERGLAQSASGQTADLGDVAQFAADDEDIWDSYVENHIPGAWRVFWHYGPGADSITIVTIGPRP